MSENQISTVKKPPTPLAMGDRGFEIRTLDEAWRLADAIHKSGLAPKSFNRPESILIALQYAAELGFKPMQGLANIAVVNGKACLYGDGLKALIESSPACEWIQETIEGEGDAMRATCKAQRVGRPEATVRTFTSADAKRAKLWGKPGPWTDYPQRMLQMRARSWCLRDQFADLLCGLGVVEELQDVEVVSSGLPSGAATPASDLDALTEALGGAPVVDAEFTSAEQEPETEEDPLVGMLFDNSDEREVYA